MSNLYRGPSIDASYQVSVHLAKVFQRGRLKCEKLTDDGQRTPSDGKSSRCLWQGELKRYSNTLYPFYEKFLLPKVNSFNKFIFIFIVHHQQKKSISTRENFFDKVFLIIKNGS